MMATIIAVLLSLFLIAGLHYSAKMNQDDTNISDGNTMKPIEMLRNRIGNKTLLVFALLLKQGKGYIALSKEYVGRMVQLHKSFGQLDTGAWHANQRSDVSLELGA